MTLFLVPAEQGVRLRATGAYVPKRVVSTRELAALPDFPMTEEEAVRLTGIATRHWAAPDEATSDMAIVVGREILERAAADRVDRILLSTNSPDHMSPGAACFVQAGLGIPPCPAMDVVGACSGFVFGLDLAVRCVLTGSERVLVLASEVRSRFIDLRDRATCALFGDGAGGCLLEPGTPGEGIIATYVDTDGRGARAVYVPAGGSRERTTAESVAAGRHTIRLENGVEVVVLAVQHLAEAARKVLDLAKVRLDDVALFIPHQANASFVLRLARFMRVPVDRFINIADRWGNTSSASAALALDVAVRSGRARPGSYLLVLVAGGGYSIGAALIRVPREGFEK